MGAVRACNLIYTWKLTPLKKDLKIAIIGGGPSALFMYKRLLQSAPSGWSVDIFEKNDKLGAGMPYSADGANVEHITNVSGNEIPPLVTSISEWMQTVNPAVLKSFDINIETHHDYKVLPRLLFGQYLGDQFKLLQQQAKDLNIHTVVHYRSKVTDIRDNVNDQHVYVYVGEQQYVYDRVIICSGHYWPGKYEGKYKGYFDSPYPPSKLTMYANSPIAIMGASLTAIDAIRSIARAHGQFIHKENGDTSYEVDADYPDFSIIMHSRSGLLPAVRFHLEDSSLGKETVLSQEEIQENREKNGGFLSLDYVFERNFKEPIREKHPEFYSKISGMGVEEFVDMIMSMRENIDPFDLFKAEYTEAEKSIKRKQSIYWKEMLAVLSFAMNYPAKYFSAEDMQRIQKTLMPLISLVIAFVPQSSAEELIALHNAGLLKLVNVGMDSHVEPKPDGGVTYHYKNENGDWEANDYEYFVDCTGQPHLAYEDFPYPGLLADGVVSPALLKFKSNETGQAGMDEGNEKIVKDELGNYYLRVPGIAINDHFQVLDRYNAINERIYIMAVPFIGGYNPDYSGLDFCEAASLQIARRIENTSSF
jgi:uncharacterized NAD(P)/FAD-binding protein YdhS